MNSSRSSTRHRSSSRSLSPSLCPSPLARCEPCLSGEPPSSGGPSSSGSTSSFRTPLSSRVARFLLLARLHCQARWPNRALRESGLEDPRLDPNGATPRAGPSLALTRRARCDSPRQRYSTSTRGPGPAEGRLGAGATMELGRLGGELTQVVEPRAAVRAAVRAASMCCEHLETLCAALREPHHVIVRRRVQ